MNAKWESVFEDDMSAHYNIFRCCKDNGMELLREFFPHPQEVNDLNFVLFSTSGIHGSYATIEDVENPEPDEDDEGGPENVTFLLVQPRLVTLRYGNAVPATIDDFDYLKQLRANSHKVVGKIGMPYVNRC